MPKLTASPTSINPRCGETVRVRIDTDPVAGQLSIDPLPDSGAVSVSPLVGATNANGYTYFEITCENRSGSCEGASVSFKANGYDGCSVSVNCHSYSSLATSLVGEEINEIRISLAETQGRLALMGRLGGISAPELLLRLQDLSSVGEWATDLFSTLILDEDHSQAPIIAYSSTEKRKVFVLKDYREKALLALGVRGKDHKRILVPGEEEEFTLEEISGPVAYPEDELPKAGSIRVRLNRKCGPLSPLRQGQCRKLKDDLYARAVFFARALCRPAPDETCTEKYIPYAEVRFYRKPGCEDFIEKSSQYGWLCAGGPPRYL